MSLSLSNKILPVGLVAALLGGTVGALVTRTNQSTANNAPAAMTTAAPLTANRLRTDESVASNTEQANLAEQENLTAEEQAYRAGFVDGARTMSRSTVAAQPETRTVYTNSPARRVVYRPAPSRRYASSRRAYYDYDEPRRGRSFWQKHRDKLTVAMGTGGGAAIGALIGGKKGAAIGALAGAGGSALYTYKIRKRDRRY